MDDGYNKDLVFDSVKKMIGFTKDYEAFDLDLLTEINTIFVILFQIGTDDVVTIDETTTWASLGYSDETLNLVKSYVVAKCRMAFDPPQSGILKEALKDRISELEFRINVAADPGLPDKEKENE